nr:PREDICTED: T-cell-specific surface glycoprotein CD28 homolog [Latimeria chalumnae]|eukprot:XP_014345613.1 PREDICTED: T-cell-specific surface glycoprotein CD28 homolog [Latimeria chalumnae]
MGSTQNLPKIQESVLIIMDPINADNYDYNGNASELKLTLLKGNESKVCTASYNYSDQIYSSSQQNNSFNCNVQNTNRNNFTFTLPNLKFSDTDNYVCKIEILYPPPYRQSTGAGTLIHVIGSCSPSPVILPENSSMWIWLPICLTAFFLVYSMTITIMYCNLQHKDNRNNSNQSDYMNMVPRHPNKYHNNTQGCLYPKRY